MDRLRLEQKRERRLASAVVPDRPLTTPDNQFGYRFCKAIPDGATWHVDNRPTDPNNEGVVGTPKQTCPPATCLELHHLSGILLLSSKTRLVSA